MQFAHPMVAQGVADHSNFRGDLFGRTMRTFRTMYRMIFGTQHEALAAARAIHKIHTRVRGTLAHDAGRFRAGTPYAANDRELLSWVWSTLVDSAIEGYECFVGDLGASDREGYYQEMRRVGCLLSVPSESLPRTHAGFRAWVEERVASDEIVVSPIGFELGRTFLEGRTGPRSLAPLFSVLAAGTLPPKLREGFALPWNTGTRVAFGTVRSAVRLVARTAPRTLRAIPQATAAEWRCRRYPVSPLETRVDDRSH
jgi:uncharacterized protein (DUF2236 family)